ncbi:ras guanine-nucleotide exchange protein-like protein [Dothidotthia symphoricarpi CBS 119687]|uniref:Ras guanine-nucleotide exchange protein-like protein n=1 Tax=Dothidotthia symphoricarpi CBS 119687 TaxID=1392245 RepID=A0A6A6A6S6_9PLEO|nr:ras guanine-nucleotide exchange protein-like protein [Dothidotthia symphoricarpi CBS 119687]KAF2127266.1 ras guanine-nucleotide exchange protein-like protein [Dothidotthia symphoricarpi CBS 119687]
MADYMVDQQEMDSYASAVVAPLNIHKTSNSVYGHSRRSSSRGTHSLRSQSQSQISPPLTPKVSSEGIAQQLSEQPVFHNYVRAFYHYSPTSIVSSSTDESSITVAINQGDVILVHSVHPNGWADGTLLASGARGWLPTNYCEPYDHPTIRNLLNALTHLWDLVRDGENGDLFAFTKQDYVRGMIAGIRFFLERTGCLSRESHLVVSHVGLRRMRKGLLGDLSTLVKAAKSLQETLQIDDAPIPVYEHLDELVLKSFKLVTRAVHFLDIWAADSVLPSFELDDAIDQRPLTPPLEPASPAVRQRTSSRMDGYGSSAHEFQAPVTQGPLSTHEDLDTATTEPPRNFSRLSFAFSLPSEKDFLPSPLQPSRPQSVAKRTSLTHRLSYTTKSQGARKGNLASERLVASQDAFVGFIASFIGLHMQSRSSEELAHITQQSVIACRQLLTVVEEVWERDSRRSQQLEETRDTMYARLTELVQATKNMFSSSDMEEEGVARPDSKRQLVDAATSCVRSAGDCVAKARLVVERIGDFEFEMAGLALSDLTFDHAGRTDQEEVYRSQSPMLSESPLETNKPLPAPPSDERQMLPPLVISESKPLPEVPQSLPSNTNNRISLQPTPCATIAESPTTMSFNSSRSSLPTLAQHPIPDVLPPTASGSLESPLNVTQKTMSKSTRNDSVNASTNDSCSTYPLSVPCDSGSIVSYTSTRATTPDHSLSEKHSSQTLVSSFGSSSELRSLASEDIAAGEEHLLETTYVHELIYNKEGQISGGSLPALVEQLTTHESTPDAVFVTTFYLTFRLFATPVDLAQCLIDRYDYIGDSQSIGVPVRLRIYNVFKGWLETHWSGESDSDALGVIFAFATGKLQASMPVAGKRLAELTSKVTEVRAGALVPRLVSSIGKTGVSSTVFTSADSNVPSPTISRSQLNALRANKEGRAQCSILDFDPLELARQMTIIESKLFCSIQPEELLALEWTKKSDSKAVNVKAMISLSTDLANLVADTILQLEDPKKRAAIIKQWIKVAAKCLELNNYDSLMAIICSLNSSMVMRLKRTWELVSGKTKARLEELKKITDVGRNYAVLRQRLHNHVAPCIPFVGIYLTDLTFIDAGNGTTRQLPGESGRDNLSVINFDKHMKTAKIIGQLQSFQVPYRLAVIPDMQDWMQAQIQRVGLSDGANVQSYYRRSLILEPRELQPSIRHSPSVDNSAQGVFFTESRTNSKENLFEFLNFNFSTTNLKGS